jgi:release factor glutamine methyltransferase
MIVKAWRRKVLKKISYLLVIPISKLYLNSERKTIIENISILVKPGVFHPSIFFSTKFLLSWLKKQPLSDLKVLELGAGSGLLSIYAAKQNAIATASDISEKACMNVKENAKKNNVQVEVVQSDLFTDIPWQQFELILINPPYYPRNPVAENEYAWFCGEDFDYFQKLFFQMKRFMKDNSRAIMVLSEDCNVEIIQSLAVQHDFKWTMIELKKNWYEENYLFEIKL